MTFKNPEQAFISAIRRGYLSQEKRSERYAGRFMCMGTDDVADLFKNIDTGHYLPVPQGDL